MSRLPAREQGGSALPSLPAARWVCGGGLALCPVDGGTRPQLLPALACLHGFSGAVAAELLKLPQRKAYTTGAFPVDLHSKHERALVLGI